MNKYPFKSIVGLNEYIKTKTNRKFHSVVSSTNTIHFVKSTGSDEVDVFKLQISGLSYINESEIDPVIEWLNK